MKKFLYSFIVLAIFATILPACNEEDTPQPEVPENPENPDTPDDPVEEGQKANTCVFNEGEEINVGSLLIFEASGKVTAYFSAKEGLTGVPEFNDAEDCTEITFPVSAIDSEIDLTKLSDDDASTHIISRLPEFGAKYTFTIDNKNEVISTGKLSSLLDNEELTIKCEFTTAETDIKCSIYLRGKFNKAEDTEPTGSEFEYMIRSKGISESGSFKKGFYHKNTWDDGWTFTYSVGDAANYTSLGNSSLMEIHVGAEELLNGEPFNVAETEYPFSFKIDYVDRSIGTTVPVTIDNDNRDDASGTITLKRNNQGLYDAYFNIEINGGDIIVKGYYADALQQRNTIYTNDDGNVSTLRAATIDISADPCVLYLSTQNGTPGPELYDIKCEVPAAEWRFGKFMAFSGQKSNVTWIDGICYDKDSSKKTPVAGGNWRVMDPWEFTEGRYVAECQVMLFGSKGGAAYYYGEINFIN